ncbi:uncharacterized protein LOC141857756 [Brevipalpus obovatus]|uniref:uncharacterized protein LOC141857756 n=1 Tax=Brevipalpus obovatus TaxID=246614 RepID=UPI003D9DD523
MDRKSIPLREQLQLATDRLAKKTRDENMVQRDVEKLEKSLHEQRMKNMREIADRMKHDGWMYPPVDKLLGL